MGRKLMRVPMDFSWPLKKTWGGYLNPYSSQAVNCDACSGSGYSPAAKLYSDQWYGKAPFDPVQYGATEIKADHPRIREFATMQVSRSPEFYGRGNLAIEREIKRLHEVCIKGHWSHHLIQPDIDALVEGGRLMDFTRRPLNQEQVASLAAQQTAGGSGYWLDEPNGRHPSSDEVNAWSLFGMGHDSINQWICVRARCARSGEPVECAKCAGEGSLWPPGIKDLHEAWTDVEPPTGDGYQLWETTSEGSPITPVFASIVALCEYAADHCSVFGSERVSAERWREMLDENFVRHEEPNPDGGTNVFL